MKKNSKKILALVMALVLSMAMLTACGGGGGSEATGYEGKYYSSKVDLGDGLVTEGEDAAGMDFELLEGGKVVFDFDGDEFEGEWTLDGDKITLTESSGEGMTGTIDDEKIVVENMLDMGMDVTFTKEKSE